MTKTDIRAYILNVLLDSWVVRGSGDYRDYERAKHAIQWKRSWKPKEWEIACKEIATYVGV